MSLDPLFALIDVHDNSPFFRKSWTLSLLSGILGAGSIETER
jgi:hypothetical protein